MGVGTWWWCGTSSASGRKQIGEGMARTKARGRDEMMVDIDKSMMLRVEDY